MDDFLVVLKNENFLISDSTFDLPFCIKIGETYFPDAEWTDLGYPVLCIWAENLLAYRTYKQANFDLYFMDGPYYINVEKKHDILLLNGMCSKNISISCFSYKCTYEHFLSIVLRALLRLKKIVQMSSCNDEVRTEISSAVDGYKRRINCVLKP